MLRRKIQSNRISLGYLLAGVSLAFAAEAIFFGDRAAAATISVSDVFLALEQASVNDIGASTAPVLFIGADDVVPNGFNGTVGVATSSDGSISNYHLLNTASTAFPNQISTGIGAHAIPYNGSNPNLLNSWALTFSNPAYQPATVKTPSSAGYSLPAFANTVTVTGGTTTPIISWAGSGNGVFVNIVDKNQCGDGSSGSSAAACAGHGTWPNTIYSKGGLPASGSFQIPSAVLNATDSYGVEVSEVYTHDGSTDTAHHNEAAISRALFDYTVSPTAPSVPINIPMIDSSGVFHFNIGVTAGTTTYLDPNVATGYIYQTSAGNPNFASVELPNIGNPSPYDLYLWNGTSFVLDTTLGPGTVFDFAAGGVSEFKVLGIDPGLGLDPNDSTAFITAVTFTDAGSFTGTMTPITFSVPESSTWAMMLIGFTGLGILIRRSRKRAAAAA